jgi:hypothetical protein
VRIAQEADRVNGRSIVVVGLLTLAITVLGVVVAWMLNESARAPIGAPGSFEAKRWGKPPEDSGGVEMIVFPRAGRRSSSIAATGGDSSSQQRSPAGAPYGWSDRGRGFVFIPIERAKELYLSRRRSATDSAAAEDQP